MKVLNKNLSYVYKNSANIIDIHIIIHIIILIIIFFRYRDMPYNFVLNLGGT